MKHRSSAHSFRRSPKRSHSNIQTRRTLATLKAHQCPAPTFSSWSQWFFSRAQCGISLSVIIFSLFGIAWKVKGAEPIENAVQQLISDADASDEAIRKAASYRLSQMRPPPKEALPALIKGLDDQEHQVWFNSITAIARIGPDAKEAIPALIEQLQKSSGGRSSRQRWYRTAFALGSIGPAGFNALKEALASDRSHVRSGAAKAIAWVGPAAEEFVPLLVEKLGDENSDVREYAAEALGSIGDSALESVMENLRAEQPDIRQAAALASQALGKTSPSIFNDLYAALEKETDSATEARFIQTLSRLRCSSPEFIATLVSRLSHDSDAIRQEVFDALLLMEPPQLTSVPPIIELLHSEHPNDQKHAVSLLGRIGPAAGAAATHLIALRSDPSDTETAQSCQSALVQIGAPSVAPLLDVINDMQNSEKQFDWAVDCLIALGEQAVPELAETLTSNKPFVRNNALQILHRIGPKAELAVPDLSRVAQSENSKERSLAIFAMAAIPAPVDTLRPLAETAIVDDNLDIRRAGATAMAALQSDARPSLPLLMKALEDADEVVAANSAKALGFIGPEAKPAVPGLQQRLNEAPLPVRLEVIRAFGGLGEAATPVLPQLIRLLSEGTPELQTAVAASLGRLGETAQEALPGIKKTLDHENAGARLAALDAFLHLENDSRSTLPILTNILFDADLSVRHLAADSLGQLGRRAQSAEPYLFGLLREPKDVTAALGALRDIRASNVELLTGVLIHNEWQVRQFAAGRLGQLGSRATNAIPELQRLTDDEHDNVSRTARFAVRSIQRAARSRR